MTPSGFPIEAEHFKFDRMDPKRLRPSKNKSFCMAPWTHTYLSPQGERRLCCASREKASFVRQYIDQPGGARQQAFAPATLDEHWNSEHLRSVRRRMLAGERLPECEICSDQVLNLHTYQRYFTETLFPHLIDQAYASTDETGATTLQPISFDYRFSNACNFKCRMCGSQLSSAWEAEDKASKSEGQEIWMQPEIRQQMEGFQYSVAEPEFARAVEGKTIREIYWVGGEPLVWNRHWHYMRRLVENGGAKDVFVRYNTNLSKIVDKEVHLFDDLLPHFKDYNVCASIDAPGKIGEYIRTGLNWEKWLENFTAGVRHKGHRNDSIVMDVTLTLPGLFGMSELLRVARELDVKMYVKIMFAFDSNKVLSPFVLPRPLLIPFLDDLITDCKRYVTSKTRVLVDTLQDMKNRPTFAEQFAATYEDGLRNGKHELERLERLRGDGDKGRLRLTDIYAIRPEIAQWWSAI